MASDGPRPGFLGNINEDQEAKLQKIWATLLRASEVPSDEDSKGCVEEHSASPTPSAPPRRMSLLSRTSTSLSSNSDKTAPTLTRPYQQKFMAYFKGMGAAPQEIKMVQKALSEISPSELRQGVLDVLKHDHPDAMMLRFLRARKWDVSKAFAMMMDAIVWRVKEMHVDEDVMTKGELHALKQERSSNAKEKKEGKDFLDQMRMGKSYVHGVDKLGRPIVVIQVRLHKPGAQTEETLERYIVHVIESVRLTLTAPVETAVMCSLRHDWVRAVQYGIWRLIRGWMDPDIAAKVQFTNSANDLAKFIDRCKLPKGVGGDADWEYKYIEPNEDENVMMEDTTTRDALIRERQQIGEEFLAATTEWNAAAKAKDKTKVQSAASQRTYLAERLRVNHWKLDPYTRARLCLDRMRVIQPGGKVDFYPKEEEVKAEEAATNEMSKTSEVQHLENLNGNGVQTTVSV
ncbi:hypothetical protein N7540_009774 [Penicillium herquei]|nr:hypothetical protein N7540_009774 [Penicillium herquei]